MCIPCRDKQSKIYCDHCTIQYEFLERKVCHHCAGMYCSEECSAEHFCPPMKCIVYECNRSHFTLMCTKCNKRYCRSCFDTHVVLCSKSEYYCKRCKTYQELCKYDKTCMYRVCRCTMMNGMRFSICGNHGHTVSVWPCYICHYRYINSERRQIKISRFTVKEYRELTVKVLNVCLECYKIVQSFSDCLILKGLPPDMIEMFILFYVNQTH